MTVPGSAAGLFTPHARALEHSRPLACGWRALAPPAPPMPGMATDAISIADCQTSAARLPQPRPLLHEKPKPTSVPPAARHPGLHYFYSCKPVTRLAAAETRAWLAPLPLTGECGSAPGGHKAPAPRTPPLSEGGRRPPQLVGRGGPGDKAGPANRNRLSGGGNDPRSCLPAAAPPPLPPGPRSRPLQTPPRAVTSVVSAPESRNVTRTPSVGVSQTKIVNKTKQKIAPPNNKKEK